MKTGLRTSASIAGLVTVLSGSAAFAELPKTMVWSAYDVGGSGYAQAVAISNAFKNNLGSTVRVIPGKNDVSRMEPLRQGKAEFSLNGIGTYFSQEAVFPPFDTTNWGPQDVRMLAISQGDACLTMTFAGDIGAKTMEDFRGKRMVWVSGSAALNYNNVAHLAFADMTVDDVELVDVGGNNSAWEALQNNQADGHFSITNSGAIQQLAAHPRGVAWPVLPHDDEESWARMQAVAPHFVKTICKDAVGDVEPWEGVSYPYPILMSYADIDDDLAYEVTKGLFETFDEYKDSAPGANGYALDRQQMEWVVPYHPGAIRYYKEIGKWDESAEEHQAQLLERQDVLQQAWSDYVATNPPENDEDAFSEGWQQARAEALEGAGMPVVWESWER